jgi:hypothetical protein
LPIGLKGFQPVLGATAKIAHPTEGFGEKLAHVINAMVIETINHSLDDTACFISFR